MRGITCDEEFWQTEADSALMSRNAGFLTLENAKERCEEVSSMLDFIPASKRAELQKRAEEEPKLTGNEEMDRIFREDAIRTFSSEKFRKVEIQALQVIYTNHGDYHQGLGFLVAFLTLFLSREDVVTVVLYLNEQLPGYFKIHNEPYLRDCKVFDRLVKQRDASLSAHLSRWTISTQYLSKWIVGMNVHVMPFQAVSRWLAILIQKGEEAVFSLGLSILERNRDGLMALTEPDKLSQRLRFDPKVHSDSLEVDEKLDSVATKGPGSFYMDMVEHSLDIKVDLEEINEVRKEIEEEIRLENERRAAYHANCSDDEIVFSDEEEDGEKDDSTN